MQHCSKKYHAIVIFASMYQILRRIILIIFLVAGADLGLKAQCTLRFSGQVRDADTREWLHAAVVRINELGITRVTDSLGRFSMEGLCPGHYDVVISHVGCETLYTHIHISADFSKEYSLPHASMQLGSVTVVGTQQSSMNREDLKGRELESVRGLSLGESLARINGVTTLQTGTNIYKPVIHGLHSNRVIILNNGIRQEGQQWGNEHAPEIDPYIANRVSVIKGASSLRYGSDAIGGVVLVEPKLLRAIPGTGGEINLAGFSNNRMGVLSGIMEGNLKKTPAFSWRAQGTVRRGGNAKTPGYWLENSGLSEYNFSLTAGWRKANWGTELYFSQFNTELGIFSGSHIGNVTDLMQVINAGTPPDYIRSAGFSYRIDRPRQEVQHNLIRSKTFFQTGSKGRFNILASWQYNNRLEFDKKRFQSSDESPQLDLSIGTAALDLVWDHNLIHGFRGTIGLSGAYQDNAYSRRLFIPNYRMQTGAIFWMEKWEKGKWLLDAGIRYDWRNMYDINNNDGKGYPKQQYQSASGQFGIYYNLKPGMQWYANISTAWRAPHVNELYSDGLHHGAARIEKGDSSLVPERSNSLQLGLQWETGRWNISVNAYQKRIDDFIYLEPVFPPQLSIRGAFPAFRFTQNNAWLTGFDASVSYAWTHHIVSQTRVSVLRARNRETKDWLIQMPADRIEQELQYEFNNGKKIKESYLKARLQYVFRQSRVPATGQIEIIRPDGTKELAADYMPAPDAYTLLGIEAGAQVLVGKRLFSVSLSVSNLLDQEYRDYMNSFRYYADEMGRNIAFRIKIPFNF